MKNKVLAADRSSVKMGPTLKLPAAATSKAAVNRAAATKNVKFLRGSTTAAGISTTTEETAATSKTAVAIISAASRATISRDAAISNAVADTSLSLTTTPSKLISANHAMCLGEISSKVKAASTSVVHTPVKAPAALLPWQQRPLSVNTTLAQRFSKKETSATQMNIEALCLLDKYQCYTQIFTDASKLAEGGVAAAFYVQRNGHADSRRMDDSTTIYAAELAAINLAVNWLIDQDTPTSAVIFTDSLSLLNSLKVQKSNSHPVAMTHLLDCISKLEAKTIFAWIPSHVGVRGNEYVDSLAKQGTAREKVELFVAPEFKNEYSNIDIYIESLWQREYSTNNTGTAYRSLEPLVSGKLKFTDRCRKKETMITRLRLGKCSLKKYLYDIKAHPDGLCSSCQVPETIEHLLLECASSFIPAKLRDKCNSLNIHPSLTIILTTRELQDLVYDLVLQHNINL